MKWNDPKISAGGKYLKLTQGDNKVRIASEVESFGKHWDNVAKKGTVCIGKENGCPECDAKIKLGPKWIAWIIDRTDGELRLLEMGWTIIQGIQKLAQNPQYAFEDKPPYDITITKEGEGLDTSYTVIADRKDIELTDNEIIAIDQAKPISEVIEEKKKEVSSIPQESTDIEPF